MKSKAEIEQKIKQVELYQDKKETYTKKELKKLLILQLKWILS